MENQYTGAIEIQLDKPRVLLFKARSLLRLEQKLGFKITELNSSTTGWEEICKMLWAGLIHEYEVIARTEGVDAEEIFSLDHAIDLMDYGSFDDISLKVGNAYKLAFQKGSQVGKQPKK